MASIDFTMSNHPKLENRTLELQILENLQHLVVQWFFQWIETRFSFALHMFFGLLPVWARYFQSRSCLSHPRRSWPEKFSADLQTLTESGWWCCNVLILKNDGVRQWEGWHRIYEMENKIHVWNHQPAMIGSDSIKLWLFPSCIGVPSQVKSQMLWRFPAMAMMKLMAEISGSSSPQKNMENPWKS